MNARNPLLWIVGLGISATFAAEAPQASRPAATGADSSGAAATQVWNSESRQTASMIPAKLRRYAQRVVKRFDRNGSGALEASEWAAMPGDPRKIDLNHDGVITVDELAGYLAGYARSHPLHDEETAWRHLPQPPAVIFQPVTPAENPPAKPAEPNGTPSAGEPEPAPSAKAGAAEKGRAAEELRRSRKYYVAPSALPPGLPDWFIERDTNGDGQLTLDEFAPDGSAAQRRLFAEYDQNGDGVITPDEVMRYNKASSEKAKPSAEQKPSSSSPPEPGGSPAR
jgi:hypothetical protein